MSNISLKNLSMTIFGESHGEAIGGVITGLPAGHIVDNNMLRRDMLRRKPGNASISTARNEADTVNIVSGVYNGYTTGAPLCIMIQNSDVHSTDYSYLENTPRPSHSDYPAEIKYGGFNDIRGGGHFSGRLTAPIVALGGICRQILEKKGIYFAVHIYNIGEIYDKPLDDASTAEISALAEAEFPVISDITDKIKEKITAAKTAKTSLGGTVECGIYNMKKGVGGPLFDGMEGKLANLLYAIPAVKGVEFGKGFGFSLLDGVTANDCYEICNGGIRTTSNNNGGITGGITNGEPIIVRAAFKPTPSVAAPQKTVDTKQMLDKILEIKGRHDPIIAIRAVPVVENMLAFGILDSIM